MPAMANRTLGQLAELVGGKVVGDAGAVITGVNTLEAAGPGEISFLSNRKYHKLLATTRASAVIVGPEEKVEGRSAKGEGQSGASAPLATNGDRDGCPTSTLSFLQVADPYFAFRQVMVEVYGFRKHAAVAPGVHRLAVVSDQAALGAGVSIAQFVTVEAGASVGPRCVLYPGCYVGANARLGADCVLFPNVTVYDGCILGDRVTLHAGTVIGQDGFGYATHAGAHHKIPQVGIVRVGDDVELGANCAIDRATLGETVIGSGTKFSDLVAIGHGTTIGEHCLLVAQVGIAGSVELGKYCVLAGQVGVVGHIKLGDQVTVAAKGGVINDVPAGQTVMGQPAIDIHKAKRNLAVFVQLADLRDKVRQLEAKVRELEGE
jgi:UDP-3-O-[3-hydroxymyristoyl] glucosamine N-acyltransferase